MYVISAHQRYRRTDRQTDGRTDAKRWHDRSIALAWSGKNWNETQNIKQIQKQMVYDRGKAWDQKQELKEWERLQDRSMQSINRKSLCSMK